MTYSELVQKLQEVERRTGLYLSDECVDLQNAGLHANDLLAGREEDERALYRAAVSAAGYRAEEAGFDINEILGMNIY